jgi:hypothetical protein
MAMVCPRCATTHDQRSQCPTCGGRLEYSEDRPRPAHAAPRWQHTPWGRILIGLLLAQGLFYGLRQLATGLLLAVYPAPGPADETVALYGLVLTQALQAVTLLAGGILAGSGQRNGAVLGAVVGVWNGVLAGLAPQSAGLQFSAVALYGDPLLQTALGALAGWLGGAIWKPLPPAEPRGPVPMPRKAAPRPRAPLFAGRIARVRVTLGIALAVAGSLSATALFNLIVRLGDTELTGTGTLLDRLVTWEIKALALIAGGTLAGANTHNGLKQGLCVGIVTSLILAALELSDPEHWLQLAALLLVSSLCLCLTGGWFGSQLFPPVVSYKRRPIGPAPMV